MFVSGYFPSRGGIVVGVKGQESTLPLGSMGDGMRRLMALATALAFTRSGCLFVDEIDTGLHYSIMPDMWKLVVSRAVASNTQVFATTHSWDCIEGLSELCQTEPILEDEVAVHKVSPALPHSVPFSGASLVRMVKSDIDPRS
jgi:predicted ATPase